MVAISGGVFPHIVQFRVVGPFKLEPMELGLPLHPDKTSAALPMIAPSAIGIFFVVPPH